MALDSRATRTTQPVPNIPRWTGDRIRRAGSPSPTMDEVVTKPGSTKIEGQRQALQNAQSARCCVNDGALLLCRWAGLSSLLRRQHDFNGGCRCQARGSAAVPIRAVYGGYTNQSGSGCAPGATLGTVVRHVAIRHHNGRWQGLWPSGGSKFTAMAVVVLSSHVVDALQNLSSQEPGQRGSSRGRDMACWTLERRLSAVS